MDQLDFDTLSRLEAGESVFRPTARSDDAREQFAITVERLLQLRARGWVRFPDGRIARNEQGAYLMVGPCDLTEAGRRALADDRRLGPRA
ncbi:MAG: hypothetical protein ACJ8DC_19120 [Gemmatimonadales bacterium]